MTEFMGNIHGVYDAKEKGFAPGCSSLHSCMTPHGPEAEVFEKASNCEDQPQKLKNTLSFMFETCLMVKLFKKANDYLNVDEDYYKVSLEFYYLVLEQPSESLQSWISKCKLSFWTFRSISKELWKKLIVSKISE